MNPFLQQFQRSLQSEGIPLLDFLINLVIATALSVILSWIYIRFGRSMSDKRTFARTFVPITLTTTIILAILQTNLVLSLGLVGALSIIRFRTAIKEPEELTYLFFCIAIGLGMGAGQRGITLVGFVFVASVMIIRGWSRLADQQSNLYLTVTAPSWVKFEQVADVLKAHCESADPAPRWRRCSS